MLSAHDFPVLLVHVEEEEVLGAELLLTKIAVITTAVSSREYKCKLLPLCTSGRGDPR